MARVFITGATGFVGGDILHTLTRAGHSGLHITSLVRDASKAQQVQLAYPDVKTILGDLDNSKLIREQSEAADIVLNFAATGHAGSAKAISEGLQARHKESQRPSYWIQISGATVYAADEIGSGRFGKATDDTYDDVQDQEKILAAIRNNPKRVVENLVISQTPSSVKTALIVGPLIYGVGRGPVNQRSVQAPEIAKATLKLGHGFKLNEGKNIWSNIHVHDLSSLVSLLVGAARENKDGFWNKDGIFNVENGELAFGDLSAQITREAHKQGFIESADRLETISAEKADSLSGHASVLWGTNARTRSANAQRNLGWKPTGASLEATIPNLIRSEGKALDKLTVVAELRQLMLRPENSAFVGPRALRKNEVQGWVNAILPGSQKRLRQPQAVRVNELPITFREVWHKFSGDMLAYVPAKMYNCNQAFFEPRLCSKQQYPEWSFNASHRPDKSNLDMKKMYVIEEVSDNCSAKKMYEVWHGSDMENSALWELLSHWQEVYDEHELALGFTEKLNSQIDGRKPKATLGKITMPAKTTDEGLDGHQTAPEAEHDDELDDKSDTESQDSCDTDVIFAATYPSENSQPHDKSRVPESFTNEVIAEVMRRCGGLLYRSLVADPPYHGTE
ncbi:hypothetical protein OPT61_g5934 [Boeremia exigua]|uniref:Uncharacterized protein n=1 Tax=Boeremia exigua TaxID=749465 RepID=A0ACC2I8N7_9PLEO|nr:hypothetical protein OPT61_g5934 [Boeremia exigua]